MVLRKSFGGFSSERGSEVAAAWLTFIETCKLQKKAALDFFNRFFKMVTEGRSDIAHNRDFEMVSPAVYYFREYYEAVEEERDGEWTTATAIYDRLRKMASSGLNANGVARFGRHLANMPGLRQKRTSGGMAYLVHAKK
jgi:hypothetical protein